MIPAVRLRQIGAFLGVGLLEVVRYPGASAFSAGIGLLNYVVFVGYLPAATRTQMTVSFVALGVLGIAFFQFSGAVAAERTFAWDFFVRTLPTPVWVRFVARLVLAVLLGHVAAFLVLAAGRLRFGLHYDRSTLLVMPALIAFMVAVFAPIGVCIGYLALPRFITPLTNLIYFASIIGTGVFTGGEPPKLIRPVVHALPLDATARFSEALIDGDEQSMARPVAVALTWTVASLVVARFAYRRDEGERYS